MPQLAAIGAAVATAASAVTVEGLMIGASVVGTGMPAIGAITGNKTLTKIGAGIGMAGGIGIIANKGFGVGAKPSVSGSTSKSAALLESDSIDSMLGTSLNGSKSSGLKQFKPSGSSTPSMDSFNNSANSITGEFNPGSFDPQLEKSFFQRANDTLTKYNPMINMLGGAGEAYMMNEQMGLKKDLFDKRLGYEQQFLDRTKANNDVPLGVNLGQQGLSRDVNAYTPLLNRR